MKRVGFCLAIASISISALPAEAAAVAVGQKCATVNQTAVAKGKKLICTKSGKKITWQIAKVAKPTATSKPEPYATDSSLTGLWAKYGWRYRAGDLVIKFATSEFNSYVATKRTPQQQVKVIAQEGVDPQLIKWIQDGATLVAQSFSYPPLSGPFYDVVASDAEWLKQTYLSIGVSTEEANGKVGAFSAGAPAFGGTTNNTWNWSAIKQNNLLVQDKAGMAQTAGHEFYHAIQENLAKRNPGVGGLEIPNWFWEGPATFVGLQTAAKIGAIDYIGEGRKAFIERSNNGAAINRSSNLEEIKANDGKVDPYAIGFAATELLVANVGVAKFNDIYLQLGKGLNFADAFKAATGVPLADFYLLFEEARSDLGFPKG